MAVEEKRDPAAEIAALTPGTVFHGVFQVIRCIKAGGMGAVYEVLQTSTQRYRALKVMLPSLVTDPEMRARFELEAKIAAGIESEHIVETIDAGIDQATGMPFIVMELLKGEELGALLKARKRLSPADVVTYLHQAALALDRTHTAGIIHRDLKPENLYLTHRDDGSPRVKILDFGVAKIVADGSVNASSTKTVGSPMYMGPEQISGEQKIGPAVDRYSLAHIAFTLLVGRPYWHVERKAADGLFPFMMQLIKGAQVNASARAAQYGVRLPEEFDGWFGKATSVDPSSRYDSAVGMIADLAPIFAVEVPAGPRVSTIRAPLPTDPTAGGPDKPAPVLEVAKRQRTPTEPTVPVRAAAPPVVHSPAPEPEAIKVEATPVRTDELSIQPVSMTKPPRAWVVPASLLVIGVLGIGGAFVAWPEREKPSPQAAAQSADGPSFAPHPGTSTNELKTMDVPSARSPAAVPSPSASAVTLSTSAVSTAQPSISANVPAKPSATSATKKAPTKGNDVLDQY